MRGCDAYIATTGRRTNSLAAYIETVYASHNSVDAKIAALLGVLLDDGASSGPLDVYIATFRAFLAPVSRRNISIDANIGAVCPSFVMVDASIATDLAGIATGFPAHDPVDASIATAKACNEFVDASLATSPPVRNLADACTATVSRGTKWSTRASRRPGRVEGRRPRSVARSRAAWPLPTRRGPTPTG